MCTGSQAFCVGEVAVIFCSSGDQLLTQNLLKATLLSGAASAPPLRAVPAVLGASAVSAASPPPASAAGGALQQAAAPLPQLVRRINENCRDRRISILHGFLVFLGRADCRHTLISRLLLQVPASGAAAASGSGLCPTLPTLPPLSALLQVPGAQPQQLYIAHVFSQGRLSVSRASCW